MRRPWTHLAWALAAYGIGIGGYARAGTTLTPGYWASGSLVLLGALGIASNLNRLLGQKRDDTACDCGHEGLDAMFHLAPCPVAELRRAARRLGYDLALIPREKP